MGISYGEDRGVMGYSMPIVKLRRCSNCGREARVRYNSCRTYMPNGKREYCGYMRVVKE